MSALRLVDYAPPRLAGSAQQASGFYRRLASAFAGGAWPLPVVHSLDAVGERHVVMTLSPPQPWPLPHETPSAGGDAAACFDMLTDAERNALRAGRGSLLLDLMPRAVLPREDVFDALHRALQEAGLPPSRVVVVNGNTESEWRYGDHCDARGIALQQRARMAPFHGSLWMLRGLHPGGPAAHSAVLERLRRTLSGLPRSRPFAAHTAADITALVASPERPPIDATSATRWTCPDPTPYLDSYFSLVADAGPADCGVLCLEAAAYHPMMNCHPFIHAGAQGTLAELRRLGFQTFGPWVDERYDTVADPGERLRAALRECERLAALPLDRLHALYAQMWPRLLHNFTRLWKPGGDAFRAEWQRLVLSRVV